jgi:ribosomal protein L32
VRRTQPRGPYAAYLNGKQIMNVGEDADVAVIRKRVETRIHEARRINREVVGVPCERCGILKTAGHICGSCGENV